MDDQEKSSEHVPFGSIWEFGRFPISAFSEFPQPQQPSVEAELATAVTEVRRGFSHRNLTVQKSTAARSLIALETWFWWVFPHSTDSKS